MTIDTDNNTVMEVPTPSEHDEPQLIGEIGDLWQSHARTQGTLKKGREEIKRIRADLSERLHQLKAVLSRPGRGGAWSSFLETQKIPRSTADRLVRAHEKATIVQEGNCPSEQISEPPQVVVGRYCRRLWPRLSQVLISKELVEFFINELRHTAEAPLIRLSDVDDEALRS
jgi:hypothetical protein